MKKQKELNIPDGLTNDGYYKCMECEEKFMCFTTTGDTCNCPCCGEIVLGEKLENE